MKKLSILSIASLFVIGLGLSSAQIIKTNKDLIDIEKTNEVEQVNKIQKIDENAVAISPISIEEVPRNPITVETD